jgi:hypothetical protein
MNTLLFYLTISLIVFIILKSIKIPKARTGQVITLLGKPYAAIGNIPGKQVNRKTGEITDITSRWWHIFSINLYFFLWPLFKTYEYPFTYRKKKKIGEEQPGDIIIWKDTKEIIVSRTGISNHVEWVHTYPGVVTNLNAKGFGTVDIYMSNTIEIFNIFKVLFSIDNFLGTTTDNMSGVAKDVVSKLTLEQLNKVDQEKFNKKMLSINTSTTHNPGLEEFGGKVIKSIFIDFEPVDQYTRDLMNSATKIEVAKNEAQELIEKQKGTSSVYEMQQDSEISKAYEKALKLGLIKVDDRGNVLELVPDPNTKILAENIGKLKELTGTLVIGGETANLLNLNNKK